MNELNTAKNLLLRNFMKIPHRKYDELVPSYHQMISADPDTAGRALVYTYLNSGINDQRNAATIALLQSRFAEFREAGRCLLLGDRVYDIEHDQNIEGFPPFVVFRVARYISESNLRSPRLMRGVMRDYLRSIENRGYEGWESVAIYNRENMKWAYRYYKFPMTDFRRILETGNYPEGSRLDAIRATANMGDVDTAQTIVDYQIPYRIAATLGPKTPPMGYALIDVMTPQELANASNWLSEKGYFEIPEVVEYYRHKVAEAQNLASLDHRKSVNVQNEHVQEALNVARERNVARVGRGITQDTVLLIDRSYSMNAAIEIGKDLMRYLAPPFASSEADLMSIAVNTSAGEITVRGNERRHFNAAFDRISAMGGTTLGRGVDFAAERGFDFSQVILISDGADPDSALHVWNERHRTAMTYPARLNAYQESVGHPVSTVFLHLTTGRPSENNVLLGLDHYGLQYDRFEINPNEELDYNIFTQVEQLLRRERGRGILDEVMEIQLPYRVGYWD